MHKDTTATTRAKPTSHEQGHRSGPIVAIRPFREGDAEAFRTLNEEWISRYFTVEEKDRSVLGDPVGQILAPGGHILIATGDGAPVGCCALVPMGPGVYEVAKMAVTEKHRNHGVGRRILTEIVALARALEARRLFLETNNTLVNAIHLYESIGFRRIPPERLEPSPYARANVFLEMDL